MQFAPAKSAAAIGYLVSRTKADLYSVMKMLYLADKVHLTKYGRTIAGDDYVAMEKGPVPDRAYNLCKYVRGDRKRFDPMPDAADLFAFEGNSILLKKDPDLEELSRSDIEALDAAAGVFASGGWKAVFKESHDAAWEAAWQTATGRGVFMVDMDVNAIASTLDNGASLIEFLTDRHPGEAEPPDAR